MEKPAGGLVGASAELAEVIDGCQISPERIEFLRHPGQVTFHFLICPAVGAYVINGRYASMAVPVSGGAGVP